MSTTTLPPATDAPVPATREFTAAWTAYVAYALSTVLFWPALVGLIVNYSKRGRPESGFIDSHHRWMLRSFWWSQVFMLVAFGVMLAGAWPLIADVVHQAIAAGDWDTNVVINVNWNSIFGSVGGAMLGSLGLVGSWLWFVYRVARGMITLADARALP